MTKLSIPFHLTSFLVIIFLGVDNQKLCANESAGGKVSGSVIQTPPKNKGTVDAGGKFTPAGSVAPPANADREQLPRTEADAKLKNNAKNAIQQTGEGEYAIGSVKVNAKDRTISLPAAVNMDRGPIEFLLVTDKGKTHESLFSTTASPQNLHIAALLLGVKQPKLKVQPDGGLKVPASNAVDVEVTWETNGPPARHRLEHLVLENGRPGDEGKAKRMSDRSWLYAGSYFAFDHFAAQQEGTFISLISDPAALVTNAGSSRGRDDIFSPNHRVLPVVQSPVTITLRFRRE